MSGLSIVPALVQGGQASKRPTMSLSAWERQVLNSIQDGLAGSDPELAALLSAFTRLTSGEEMPTTEEVRAGSRRALRRLRRARWRSRLRRARQRLGFQRAALLVLWLLTTAALIAVALSVGFGNHSATCTQAVPLVCAGSVPEHSTGSPSPKATTSQTPQQQIFGIPQIDP